MLCNVRNSLREKAGSVLEKFPHLLQDLCNLARNLIRENPSVSGGGKAAENLGGMMVVGELKRAWVTQRLAELTEVAGCMILTAHQRCKVSGYRFFILLLVSLVNSWPCMHECFDI